MVTPQARLMRWRTTANVVWSIIGVLVLLVAAGIAFGRVAGALGPFVVAFLIVFLLQGAVSGLERRGMSRTWAVVSCFCATLVGVSLIAVFLVPPAVRQIVEFAEAVPGYVREGETVLSALQQQYSDITVPEGLSSTVGAVADSVSDTVVSTGRAVAQGVLIVGSGVAAVFFNFFLALVIAFWTLKDMPKIRRELRVLAGDKYEDDLENLVGTVVRVVGGYLRGQTIVSLITGLIAWIGLSIIGFRYALVLAIITVILNFVPYLGPIVSGFIAGVVGLFTSPLTAVLAIVVIIAAQQLTDLLVTPRVMSEQVDLHPTLVVFSLLIGGTLFGFWGMVFAIPTAATVKGLFVYYYERRTNTLLATQDGALFRSNACEDDTDACDSADAAGSPVDLESSE